MDTSAPHDTHAELEVLGCILRNPEESMIQIMGNHLIEQDDFFEPRHQMIANAIWHLFAANRTINVTAIASWLNGAALLEIAGGLTFLSGLVSFAGDLDQASERVVRKKIRREILDQTAIVATSAQDEGLSEEQILDQWEQAAFDIRRRQGEEIMTLGDMAFPWQQRVIQRRAGDMSGAIRTQLAALDDVLEEIDRNAFVIIGGRPGDGKSSLLKYITLRNAILPPPDQRKGVYIADFEEGPNLVAMNFVAAITGLNTKRLKRSRNLTDDEMDRIQAAINLLGTAPVFVDSAATMTVREYKSRVQHAMRLCDLRFHTELLFHSADYLTRMTGVGESEVGRNTSISHGMRDLCQQRGLDIPSISTAQLSRAPMGQNGRPREYELQDLRESGAFEQDATVVIFPIRPWMMDPPNVEVVRQFEENIDDDGATRQWRVEPVKFKVAKNRGGEAGGYTRTLLWEKYRNRYVEDPRVERL